MNSYALFTRLVDRGDGDRVHCLGAKKCFLRFYFFFQEGNRVSAEWNVLTDLLLVKIIGKQGWAGGRLNL